MARVNKPTTWVPTSELYFDERNPRLFLEDDVPQRTVFCGAILFDEVALSIANNGYFVHEPLFVTREDGRSWKVIVGWLPDSSLREDLKADLPDVSAERMQELQTLPVITCTREEVWEYLGFKHVNGGSPMPHYVAWLYNDLGIPLDEIARSIGDRHWTVRRLYR